MPFELTDVTKVTVTNANPRRELHGEASVRAIDISFSLTGENTLLDLIQPGLREHHYFNKALKDGQESVPGIIIPLPNLRFPRLPTTYNFAKGEKWRGYRLLRDFGMADDHIDFTDAVMSNLHYEVFEGGSCTVFWTIQYNGEELQDNDLYGELSGLASEGDIHIKLLAPAELVPAKKGYRAGQPDTAPPPNSGLQDGQQQLGVGDDKDPDDIGPGPKTAEEKAAWPFPNSPQTPEEALTAAAGADATA